MADTPQDIQLRRFVRPIGVTGLGMAQTGHTDRRLQTLNDSFDGVLATGVSAEPGTPPAELSYLTLAPLVAQGLARDERDGGAGPTSSAESGPSDADDDSGSTAPEGDELRVRELLHDDVDASASERDLRPTDLTVSDARKPTINDEGGDRGRSDRSGRSDEHSSLIGRGDQVGQRSRDGPAAVPDWSPERSENEPPRTVADQSTHDVDISGANRDTSGRNRLSERQGPGLTDGPGPDLGSDSPAGREPSDAVPTTVVHRGTPGSDESGAENGRQTGPATEAGAGRPTPGNGRGEPSLTVTGPGMTGVSTETDAASVSKPNGTQQQSQTPDSPTDETGDVGVTERTVIRSDGRLNERVFDRLYQEVSRKMRLERDREGR